MQTYFYLHVSGQKGPITVAASAYVARLDADGGLYLDPQMVKACIGCVPDVSRIYCDSQDDPVGEEETRFTICEAREQLGSASEAGALTVYIFTGSRPTTFETQVVDGPWWKAVVQTLKGLPECAEAVRRAAAQAVRQMVWHVAPEPA